MVNTVIRLLISFLFLSFAFAQKSAVDSLYNTLSDKEKIGQLLMPRINSLYTPGDAKEKADWEYAIDSLKVGGFIVFRGDVLEQANIAGRLQYRSSLPLLLAADYENGTGSIYNNGTHFVTAMGIGATEDPNSAYEMGRITALEARALGVHMVLAPVADVNTNPDNIIINYRSFGDDPARVSDFVTAYIKGLQENGAIAVAKHFPGHGDVSRDTHLEFVVQKKSVEEWSREELIPFKASIDAGAGGIMTVHISFPALGDSILPATLSKNILTDLLRDKLKYEGLVVTDALEMGGIRNLYWSGEAALRAFNAGADILLIPLNLKPTAIYLLEAYRNGRITEERLDFSVKKILQAKLDLGLWESASPDNKFWNKVGLRENIARADSISSEALTLVRQQNIRIPLEPGKRTSVVIFSDQSVGTSALAEFHGQFRYLSNNSSFFAIDERSTDDEYDIIEDELDESEQIILAIKAPVLAYSGTAVLHEKQQEYLHEILDDYPNALVIVFGNPYFLRAIPEANNALLVYTYSRMMQRVMAKALFGTYDISGKLPVTIPGIAPRGSGIKIEKIPNVLRENPIAFRELDQLIEKAIADSVFPGCQVAIGKNGRLLKDQSYGYHTYEKIQAVEKNHLYDLASLTKVLATTLSLMKLYNDLDLQLHYPLEQFYPGISEDKAKITIQQLMTHTSGFKNWIRFYERTSDPDSVLCIIFSDTLDYDPGSKHVYSDLNFIILRDIAEMLSGENIWDYANKHFYEPLGLRNIQFNPADTNRCVPSEILGGIKVHGIVQDRNARMLKGISGHAGLFSNAGDIAVIAQMLLNNGLYGNKRYLKKKTIEKFTTRQFEQDNWTHALGWDTPSREGSLVGENFPRETIGHWGYAGTSVWIDFENNIFVVLLTNRTYPDRANRKISKFRPMFHDRVFEVLEEVEE